MSALQNWTGASSSLAGTVNCSKHDKAGSRTLATFLFHAPDGWAFGFASNKFLTWLTL